MHPRDASSHFDNLSFTPPLGRSKNFDTLPLLAEVFGLVVRLGLVLDGYISNGLEL